MKWICAKDKLPEHGQELLLRYNGIFNLATFDKERMIFRVKGGADLSFSEDILWSSLISEPSDVPSHKT